MMTLLEQNLSLTNFAIFLFWGIVMLMVILGFVTYAIYFERKVIGWMQLRVGPNRTGPFGLLQSKAERTLFILAPIITFIPAFTVIATIPFTDKLFNANLDVGLLYYVALSGISTIGIILAGWASNNKYALLGGMRSAAQMISYEIPLVISVIGVIMMSSSLNLRVIVENQAGGFWHWHFLPQIIGFVVFYIAGISELNRTPFDLPEAESELVAGYHVEYSGFRFAFFMLAEYVYVFAVASLITVLFLGGWHAPFGFLDFIPGIIWFLLKFSFIVFTMFWLRATMPRMRIDQLMGLGWKVLLPLALLNIFVTAIYMQLIS
jgi:NADH-quinone oxidoreductase subunit H